MNSFDIIRLSEPLLISSFDISSPKDVLMHINILPGTPIKYYGDENITSLILGDLLSNAVKFANEGSITITVYSNKDDNLIISVENTGIGISEEDQRFIFETFYASASQTVSALYGSCSRVCLTLASKLISLVCGSLSVTSKLGIGSKFTAVFPSKPILIPYIPHSIRRKKMQTFCCFDFEHIKEIHQFSDFYGCQFTNNVDDID